MTELPPGWRLRRPTLDDVAEILAVVHACDIASVGEPDFSDGDVREVLTAPNMDPARDSWLALDADGAVVAWAYVENPSGGPRDFVEVYAHPERGGAAQVPLLDRLLTRVAERAAELGHQRMTARGGAVVTETGWAAALRSAGFRFVKRYARMRRSLAGVPAAPPVPPPGVTVRAVRPDDDADLRAFHAVLEEAFADTDDHQPMSYPAWRQSIAALPSVAWDEWFVAEVAGAPAGVLQSSDQGLDADEGWVKMLAVRRDQRRRGIGAALLGRAFAAYAAKGRRYAGLGVDLANPTSPASLYRAAGMAPAYEADFFERPVDAARRLAVR